MTRPCLFCQLQNTCHSGRGAALIGYLDENPVPFIYPQPIGERMFSILSCSFGLCTIGEHQSAFQRRSIGSRKCQSNKSLALIGCLRGGGSHPSVDVVSGGEITLSVVVRFVMLHLVPSIKMIKS